MARGIRVRYFGSMRRWYVLVLGLALLMALASCTSTPTPAPTAEATVSYARYYFIAPTDTGVLEVWASPATICYATQSFPARPIDLIAKANDVSNRVVHYAPPKTEYCDRAVDEAVVAALLSDPSSFVIRWSPQAGEPEAMTPLTPTSST